MKTCNHKDHIGERTLPLSDFPTDRSRPDNLHSSCKECMKRRRNNWNKRVYANEPGVQSLDEFRESHRNNTRRIREKRGLPASLFASCKGRATKKKLEFTISVDDIIIPTHCPILGVELIQEQVFSSGGAKTRPSNYPTVDRIDSSKGYTPDNIQVISWRANSLKSNATLQEMTILGEWASKLL